MYMVQVKVLEDVDPQWAWMDGASFKEYENALKCARTIERLCDMRARVVDDPKERGE